MPTPQLHAEQVESAELLPAKLWKWPELHVLWLVQAPGEDEVQGSRNWSALQLLLLRQSEHCPEEF